MSLAPRTAIVSSVGTVVVSALGFVVVLLLNAFVLDDYDAFGEVDIPGTASLELPAGEVTVNFHTVVRQSQADGALPVPELQMSITPPEGVAEAEVIPSPGATTTINSDAWVRVWQVRTGAAGVYRIATDGAVDGYIAPRLAFGRDDTRAWLAWVFGAGFGVGMIALALAVFWHIRTTSSANTGERGPD